MRHVTTQQMKGFDHSAINEFGIPSLILMENAGRSIADQAEEMVGGRGRVLVLCGKGNNGGDGFVAARHLFNRGFEVQVLLLEAPGGLKEDPKMNLNILTKMKVPLEIATGSEMTPQVKKFISNSDLICDAIFGVGLKRAVTGFTAEVIGLVNASHKPVLSVDIPSGIDSDSGEEFGISVRAKRTGTLGAAKQGLFLKAGQNHAGRVVVLDISLPRSLTDESV